jgi:hypothetical protein
VEVARATFDEALDQPADLLADVGRQLLDLAGDELRVEDPPVAGVHRRIDLEREQGLVAEAQTRLVRERLGVAQRPEDVLVARQHHHVVATEVGLGDRALLAELPVGRVRAVGHFGGEQSQRGVGGVEIGHRRSSRPGSSSLRTLPVAFLGSSSRKAQARGTL